MTTPGNPPRRPLPLQDRAAASQSAGQRRQMESVSEVEPAFVSIERPGHVRRILSGDVGHAEDPAQSPQYARPSQLIAIPQHPLDFKQDCLSHKDVVGGETATARFTCAASSLVRRRTTRLISIASTTLLYSKRDRPIHHLKRFGRTFVSGTADDLFQGCRFERLKRPQHDFFDNYDNTI